MDQQLQQECQAIRQKHRTEIESFRAQLKTYKEQIQQYQDKADQNRLLLEKEKLEIQALKTTVNEQDEEIAESRKRVDQLSRFTFKNVLIIGLIVGLFVFVLTVVYYEINILTGAKLGLNVGIFSCFITWMYWFHHFYL